MRGCNWQMFKRLRRLRWRERQTATDSDDSEDGNDYVLMLRVVGDWVMGDWVVVVTEAM